MLTDRNVKVSELVKVPSVLDAPKINRKTRKPTAKCPNWFLTHKDSLEFIKAADTRAKEKEELKKKIKREAVKIATNKTKQEKKI